MAAFGARPVGRQEPWTLSPAHAVCPQSLISQVGYFSLPLPPSESWICKSGQARPGLETIWEGKGWSPVGHTCPPNPNWHWTLDVPIFRVRTLGPGPGMAPVRCQAVLSQQPSASDARQARATPGTAVSLSSAFWVLFLARGVGAALPGRQNGNLSLARPLRPDLRQGAGDAVPPRSRV